MILDYRFLGHGLNLGHLISHRARRVRREKTKKLCDLCGLCERRGRCDELSKIPMAEIRTNSDFYMDDS
jgi:hypothetical protein